MTVSRLRLSATETLHVAIDMQRLFAEATEWRVATLAGIIAPVLALARTHPRQTLFTRFMTPSRIEDAAGDWHRFYARWPSVIGDRMDAAMLDLIEPFPGLAPPAEVYDKTAYSAFLNSDFVAALSRRMTRTLVLTGVETDVCVLATALDAVDRGFHVVVASDAVTSASVSGHRAAFDAIYPRFDQQIEVATTAEIIAAWPED